VQAVKGISFQVERGEIYGLLGPNGADKTTTLSMLSPAAALPGFGALFAVLGARFLRYD